MFLGATTTGDKYPTGEPKPQKQGGLGGGLATQLQKSSCHHLIDVLSKRFREISKLENSKNTILREIKFYV